MSLGIWRQFCLGIKVLFEWNKIYAVLRYVIVENTASMKATGRLPMASGAILTTYDRHILLSPGGKLEKLVPH